MNEIKNITHFKTSKKKNFNCVLEKNITRAVLLVKYVLYCTLCGVATL